MPIQYAIWKIGAQPASLSTSRLVNEQLLEEVPNVSTFEEVFGKRPSMNLDRLINEASLRAFLDAMPSYIEELQRS
jgi:hypothetical protein